MRRPTVYQEIIRKEAAAMGVKVDPRHVEAWMRSEYGTLGHLDGRTYRKYVRLTAGACAEDLATLEDLAQLDRL